MKALKFELEVPFWCSFGEFSSLNIKLSYPFPPLTTLFGLIQNALGKPALHNIKDDNLHKKIMKEYIGDFNKLKFSIIINNSGEKIEDYLNIHKGNREKEKLEDQLGKYLKKWIKDSPFNKEINKNIKVLKKYSFNYYILNNLDNNSEFDSVYQEILELDSNILTKINDYWDISSKGIKNYEINKIWLKTQINRQRLISPSFSIYILSNDENSEFSLKNIKDSLENPKRPLYLGENDDVVNILNISLVDIKKNKSSHISSVLPGLYSNTELVNIPSNLKFDIEKDYLTLCSIPKGKLDCEVDCFTYCGENFVFL